MKNLDFPNLILLMISIVLYGVVIHYIWSVLNKHKDVINSEKFSVEKKIRMTYNLLIRTGDIRSMTFLIITLSFFSFFNFGFLGQLLYKEPPEHYLLISGGVSLFIAGFAGYIQYFREEMPWRLNIERGWIAKISGIILMITFWGASAFAIVGGVINWLS